MGELMLQFSLNPGEREEWVDVSFVANNMMLLTHENFKKKDEQHSRKL
jgi:hypothetical protein